MPSFATKLSWSIKRRGLVGTLRLAALKPPRKLSGWLWDTWNGVDTSGIAELENLSIESSNSKYAIRYQATPVKVFTKIMSSLGIRYEDFEFVDYGSGKGRTLLLAAGFPFRSVTGIEFARELHRIAVNNIATYRGPWACPSVQSVYMDATEYRPPGNAVLYFNFPFQEPVMRKVVANIRHPAFVVTYEPNPAITRLLDSDPAFHSVIRRREYIVYRSVK